MSTSPTLSASPVSANPTAAPSSAVRTYLFDALAYLEGAHNRSDVVGEIAPDVVPTFTTISAGRAHWIGAVTPAEAKWADHVLQRTHAWLVESGFVRREELQRAQGSAVVAKPTAPAATVVRTLNTCPACATPRDLAQPATHRGSGAYGHCARCHCAWRLDAAEGLVRVGVDAPLVSPLVRHAMQGSPRCQLSQRVPQIAAQLRLVARSTPLVVDLGGGQDVLSLAQSQGWDVAGIYAHDQERDAAVAAGLHADLGRLDTPALAALRPPHLIVGIDPLLHTGTGIWQTLADRLAPNGLAVLALPNTGSLQAARAGAAWSGWADGTRRIAWSLEGIEQILHDTPRLTLDAILPGPAAWGRALWESSVLRGAPTFPFLPLLEGWMGRPAWSILVIRRA